MNVLPSLIAKRFSFKSNKNYIVFYVSLLCKIGISISVLFLILSFSALNGFQILLNQKILSTLPHGIIQLTDQTSYKWYDVIKKLKSLPGIIYSEPYIVKNGLLIKNNIVQFVEIKSFDNMKYLKKKFI